MLTKTMPAAFKADESTDDTGQAGQFEAIVSVFGNVDFIGDRVVKGAFADTLKAWEAKGDPIPVLWSHMSADPDYHIGYVEDAKETDTGLWVRGQLDLEAPKAQQVWRLLKGRRVTQFSFAYDIDEAGMVTEDGEEINELRKLTLHEVGPTLLGMNPATQLLDTKTLAALVTEVREGTRPVSAELEALIRTVAKNVDEIVTMLDNRKTPAKPGPSHQVDPTGSTAAANRGPVEALVQIAQLDDDESYAA